MLKFEDAAVERAALAGEAYIAIPVEVYQSAPGSLQVTAYASCEKIARHFLSLYGADPFCSDALAWLGSRIAAFMAPRGYKYNAEASEVILEYAAPKNGVLQLQNTEAIQIQDQYTWLSYENETGADPDFLDDKVEPAFAVVENRRIVSCACINDAFYANGAVEVYVETAPAYRGRGYGKRCAASLISHLQRRGLDVLYKCYATNSASAAIACACGLERTGRRASFVCYADV